ncbi:MAG TPA: response regulator [Candidatus Sulfotelmatobacter sp.]|jgi:DNA-binding response OmpR family regulator
MDSFVPSCAPALNSVKECSPGLIGLNDWKASQTVLLVEDEPFVRNALAEAVESAGYKVLIASNAAEALGVQENGIEEIDLLLADIVMPNINGHELARKILALSPHTEVLLMSGYEEQVIRCEQSLEGVDYLAKPFSIPTLLQRVRGLLGKRSRRQQELA